MPVEQRNEQGRVQTIDLNFMGAPGAIAAYLIPHSQGAALVECGPVSSLPALIAGLESFHLSPEDITDVLLTHIHLDHAGAAGWLARQGARVHVHEAGAAHLLNPEKLLASAARIYGEMLNPIFGDFLPVPADRLVVLRAGDEVAIHELRFQGMDTPGHAEHHLVYFFEGICFTGDIGGVRLPGPRHLRLPTPPPEFHIEKWLASTHRLQEAYRQGRFSRIAPTHYGIYPDPDWHLGALEEALYDVQAWMEANLPGDPPIEALTASFLEWSNRRTSSAGLQTDQLEAYEAANPTWMSPPGLQRYWRKHRN